MSLRFLIFLPLLSLVACATPSNDVATNKRAAERASYEQAAHDAAPMDATSSRKPASEDRELIKCKAVKISNEKLNAEIYRDTFSVEGYPVVSVTSLGDGLNPDFSMTVGANPPYEKGVAGVIGVNNYSERRVSDYRVIFKDRKMLRLQFDGRQGQLSFGLPADVLANQEGTVFAALSCKIPSMPASF